MTKETAHRFCGRAKNFKPQLAWQGPADSVRSPSHQDLLAKQREDHKRLTPAQADVLLAPRPEIELYRTSTDPHQLNNLAGQPDYASIQRQLTEPLAQWMEETRDSVPENISTDLFDRQTGERLKRSTPHQGTTPGEDRQADQVNAAGPR